MVAEMRRSSALALLCACAACAGPGASVPESPAPVFVRERGIWAPEDLHRDVGECADAARAELTAEPVWLESERGAAAAELRRRVVACMGERGWTTGNVAQEEWAE
jgi:hypothetical protein